MDFSDKQWQGLALVNTEYLQTWTRKPSNITVVVMFCSGGYRNMCSNQERYWNCKTCKELLEYGFDGYFYCRCGRAPTHAYNFKCNDPHHGTRFTHSVSNGLSPSIEKTQSLEEINILLLGGTGIGKSTLINGISNQMTYETFDEAKKGRLHHMVASQFTTSDFNEHGEYVEKIFKIGFDKNEKDSKGSSTTQKPQSYIFQMSGKRIRFIDTPGIEDTRESIYGDKYFKNIFSYLKDLPLTHGKLHGILIVLKSNESRLSVTFKYCIQEMLAHLHRDASRNIIFVFTNSRNTNYGPGDTLPILKVLLSKIKDVKIPLMEKNTYFLDNEFFRFLVLLKNGIKFSQEQEKNYAESWDISVKETKRLLDHIFSSEPHIIKDTLSLNRARKMIVSLTKPLADICQNIEANITNMKDKEKELANLDIHTKKRPMMYKYFEPKKIDNSRKIRNTVCVETIKHSLKNIKESIEKFENEKDTIIEVSAKFTVFLKTNSIFPYNDAMEVYLTHLIETEQAKVSNGGDNKTIKGLKQMLAAYKEQVKIINDAIEKRSHEKILPSDISCLMNQLYALPLSGKSIKKHYCDKD